MLRGQRRQLSQLTAYKQICHRVVKTVIPKPTTTTITKVSTSTTSTVIPKKTDLFLTTVTETTTIEDSTVTTATATSFTTTITITTSTSTIPAPAGFTPAASDVSYRAKKREVPKRFSRAKTSINRQNLTLKVNAKKCEYSPALYPQAVNCREVIKTFITKTVTLKQCKKTPTRTVILPRHTSTKEITTATTSTSTIIQADETLTVTARTLETTVTTSTSTTTSTTTLTETQTSFAPSATFYAACASNNLISAANGNHGIDSINFKDDTSNNDIIEIGTTSAYKLPCGLPDNVKLPAATFGTSCQTNSNVLANRGVVISNGLCGRIQNLGNVG